MTHEVDCQSLRRLNLVALLQQEFQDRWGHDILVVSAINASLFVAAIVSDRARILVHRERPPGKQIKVRLRRFSPDEAYS